MSFSKEVKTELEKQVGTARHCRIAEAAALTSMCGSVSFSQQNTPLLVIFTENISVARKYFTLIQKTFNITLCLTVRRHPSLRQKQMYFLRTSGKDGQKLIQALKLGACFGDLSEQDFLVNSLLVQSACCRRAFIRGAFLASGSVNDPKKSYHFEIVCGSRGKAERLKELMNSFDLGAKIVSRKKNDVVYIKEGSQIVEALNVMEAHVALMKLENVRILKEISGDVNRKVNCETANINKTVSAAVEQIEDINLIQKTIGLEGLSRGLKEIALARLDYPDATLAELGEALSPPVGKSGVNHRLRKLKVLASSIRESEESLYDNQGDDD